MPKRNIRVVPDDGACQAAANDGVAQILHLVSQRKEHDTLLKQLTGTRLFCRQMGWDFGDMYLMHAIRDIESLNSIKKTPAGGKC